MKSFQLLIVLFLVILIGGSCKKHKRYPKSPPPSWTLDDSGKYPATMTVVVQLPENLQHLTAAAGQLGAFAGEECRGLAQEVQMGGRTVYFILIRGTTSEHAGISFQYYGAANSRMYATEAILEFEADGTYGTVDVPAMLNLKPVN